jgi:NADH dehydrogenase [ubiquinone] 1 alpha subcomplex assembly factor 6
MSESLLSFPALEVKNNDYYRYICCLFTPQIFRERLFALYAFNNEIAKIKDVTSDPMTGLIRLTWWREALDEIYSGKNIRKHEIVKALAEVIKITELPRNFLDEIIEARETDLEPGSIQTMADFEKYMAGTSTSLLIASLHIVGVKSDKAKEAAGHIGTAYALIGIMRALKWNAAKRHIILPKDMLVKYGVTEDDISEGRHMEKTCEIIRELCDKISMHLKHACALKKHLPKTALPIYLHATIASCFLKNIKKHNYDLFHSDLERGKVGVLVRMFFTSVINPSFA